MKNNKSNEFSFSEHSIFEKLYDELIVEDLCNDEFLKSFNLLTEFIPYDKMPDLKDLVAMLNLNHKKICNQAYKQGVKDGIIFILEVLNEQ